VESTADIFVIPPLAAADFMLASPVATNPNIDVAHDSPISPPTGNALALTPPFEFVKIKPFTGPPAVAHPVAKKSTDMAKISFLMLSP
jgi:hypothetical protein